MGVIKYESNNSGGRWWLSDDDWKRLEDAGWVVHWIHDREDPSHHHEPPTDELGRLFARMGKHSHGYDREHQFMKVTPSGERFLGALATDAVKATDDPQAAVDEWERVTGQDASAEGCNCCGEPHSFSFTDDDGNTRYSGVEVTRTELRWS